MNADKLVRRTGYLAVFAVAAVAALLSYWHAVTVVGRNGEPGVYGHLYPALTDGLIAAASMVLLDAARHRETAPRLAWWLVGGGIAATLTANVLDGVSFGFLGAVIAAWPALAFVGAYEMIMVLVRSAARRADDTPGQRVHPADPVAGPPRPQPPEFATFTRDLEPPSAPPTLADMVRQAAEPVPDPPTELFNQYAGQVNVRNPVSRLDRKVPIDQRSLGTGQFPAIRE